MQFADLTSSGFPATSMNKNIETVYVALYLIRYPLFVDADMGIYDESIPSSMIKNWFLMLQSCWKSPFLVLWNVGEAKSQSLLFVTSEGDSLLLGRQIWWRHVSAWQNGVLIPTQKDNTNQKFHSNRELKRHVSWNRSAISQTICHHSAKEKSLHLGNPTAVSNDWYNF